LVCFTKINIKYRLWIYTCKVRVIEATRNAMRKGLGLRVI